MDNIILAAVAAFIVYRLYITLGEKTGFQGDEKKPSNVVDINNSTAVKAKTKDTSLAPQDIDDVPSEFAKDIETLKSYDSSFLFKEFLENATSAFEFILQAYADGDRSTLRQLTSKSVFTEFDTALKELRSNKQTLDITLIRIESVTVKSIAIERKTATIQIEFVTEQVPIIKDRKGGVVEGSPNQIDQIVDHWTFERDMRSSDPLWILSSTAQ